MKDNQITSEKLWYIGDDLNDLPPMSLVKFAGFPADSCKETMERTDYVSNVKGGSGAVRDVIEYLLETRREWDKAVPNVYGIGV